MGEGRILPSPSKFLASTLYIKALISEVKGEGKIANYVSFHFGPF